MKLSKFIKVERNILLEYIYDDNNLIGEDYKISVDATNNEHSFISADTSGTNNIQPYQLFTLDPISRKYGIVDNVAYPFVQVKNYSAGIPLKFDRLKIHIPVNYTFAEYKGFHIKVYTFDYNNQKTYTLSSFYFDMTNIAQQSILNYSSPPLLFQEKLWGKNIEIAIPSAHTISLQRENSRAKSDSINYNLTAGIGLSLNSPVFVDFSFIEAKMIINNVTTYQLSNSFSISVPQTPEFENLGIVVEESTQGDYFDIYGTYNGTLGEFKTFIDTSVTLGNRYYVEYVVTTFEQNIKGKTATFVIKDNFNQMVEFRPIIKFSTTTAIIDVEMRLINAVDDSVITRRASYGMIQSQLSKYSLSLTKINISSANKPKIYNLAGMGADDNSLIKDYLNANKSKQVIIEQVKVPFPVLIDRFNIIAKSENVRNKKDIYYGIGKLQIVLYPFDNNIKFHLAVQVTDNAIEMMNLTNTSNIRLVFKNSQIKVESNLSTNSDDVKLDSGIILFKVQEKQITDIRRIFDSGNNVFYITTTNNDNTTVIYSGTFKMFDSTENINALNTAADLSTDSAQIILDSTQNTGTAIVTRRILPNG